MTNSTSFTSTSSETIGFKVESPCISSTTALLSSAAGSAAPTPLGRMTASVPYSSVQASSLCDCQHRAAPIILICRYCGFMLVHGVPETGTAFKVRGQELAQAGIANGVRLGIPTHIILNQALQALGFPCKFYVTHSAIIW